MLGHADRQQPTHDYCLGLLMPIERKSVEPMAAVTAPAQVAAKHQFLLHFVGNAPWSDAAMLAKVRELVLPVIERSGPIEAWIIDDTGFPKKGRHSVGVTQDQPSPRFSRDLPFPRVIDPEAPPIRPERHIPNSIITVKAPGR